MAKGRVLRIQSGVAGSKYHSDIDGLRAIAVLSVVAYHAFPGVVRGGFIGVDIFFVISGYLISGIIYTNIDNGTFSFSEFYAKRIRRIFPALLTVLVFCYIVGQFFLLGDEYTQLNKHISAAVAFISNFVLWGESGYFDNSADTKILLHLWSLGIEEQFYIIWPFLLWAAWKLKIGWLKLGIVVWVVSFGLNLYFVHRDAVETFYFPQTRFWELLSGGLLSWLTLYGRRYWPEGIGHFEAHLTKSTSDIPDARVPSGTTVRRLISNIQSILGCLFIAYGLVEIRTDMPFPGSLALIPTAGSVLIIAAGTDAWINKTILSNAIVVWVGLISFPIYLWHWPLLSFARIIEGVTPDAYIRSGAVLASILLAGLTYKFIELPLRFGSNKRAKTISLVCVMFALGLTSLYAYLTKLPSMASLKVAEDLHQLGWKIGVGSPEQNSLCAAMFPERFLLVPDTQYNFCLLQREGEPNVAMIGDSQNLSLFPGLASYGDYNIVMLAASEAAPLYNARTMRFMDSARSMNYKLTNQALDYASNSRNIKVVILSFIGGLIVTSPNSPIKIIDMSAPENHNARDVFVRSLRQTASLLVSKGKKVIYVLPNPILAHDIYSCLSDHRPLKLSHRDSQNCAEPVDVAKPNSYKTYIEWVTTALSDLPGVMIFDASTPFCDATYCYAQINKTLLYRDGLHLSVEGSKLVSYGLRNMILPLLNSK